jgi:hypothetical protein
MKTPQPNQSKKGSAAPDAPAGVCEMNIDPTRAKCVRLDGSTVSLPFVKKGNNTTFLIDGRWLPLVSDGRGTFVCGQLSFKRIYFPDEHPATPDFERIWREAQSQFNKMEVLAQGLEARLLEADKRERKLLAASIRMMVGITKKSTPTCEYYEGIEFDGADEAQAAIASAEGAAQ